MSSTDNQADRLMLHLLQAQAEFARAKAAADVIVRPAREQREEAVQAALDGGISLRVAAQATGLSHMRISQIRDGK
jgi:DNA invertase Pin-like site-specific DNA recombinase